VVLLSPLLVLPVLPLDPIPLIEVPIHRLELGDAPLSRKMVDPVPIVLVVAHHPLPSCVLWPSEFLLHLHHQDQLALLESHQSHQIQCR
jgi:hypothetical protein